MHKSKKTSAKKRNVFFRCTPIKKPKKDSPDKPNKPNTPRLKKKRPTFLRAIV